MFTTLVTAIYDCSWMVQLICNRMQLAIIDGYLEEITFMNHSLVELADAGIRCLNLIALDRCWLVLIVEYCGKLFGGVR